MLVICALALVVAAAVFLVIGLAGGDVGDLYLSMVLCVASLVVVAVSARLSHIRAAPAAADPPAPVAPIGSDEAEAPGEGGPDGEGSDAAAGATTVRAPEPAATGPDLEKRPTAAGSTDDGSIWAAGRSAPEAAPQVEPEPAREPAPAPGPGPRAEVEAVTAGEAAPPTFPIADYDDLAVAQILPLVPRLWPEEVPVVAARERATKARPAVLDALAAAAGDPSLAFPIAEYESLDTEQITRLLDRLDAADLATVQAAERSGPARVGVLVAVANRLATRT